MSRTHGLDATYRAGCRCNPCREAHNDAQRVLKRQRAERLAADPSLAPHGSAATYGNWGCRCRPCTEAQYARICAYRARQRVAS